MYADRDALWSPVSVKRCRSAELSFAAVLESVTGHADSHRLTIASPLSNTSIAPLLPLCPLHLLTRPCLYSTDEWLG
jgi:hypothetical protein